MASPNIASLGGGIDGPSGMMAVAPMAEADGNNVRATATTVDPAGGVTGAVNGVDDRNDWYEFTADQTGNMTIDVTNIPDSVNLYVYDYQGERVASRAITSADGTFPFDSIGFSVRQGDSYFVQVVARTADTDASYQFTGEIAERTGVPGSTNVDALWPETDGSLGGADTADVYSYYAKESGTLALDLTGLSDNLTLNIYGQTGTLLASSANSGTADETLTYDVTAGAGYQVEVAAVDGASSDYHLSAGIDYAFVGDPATAVSDGSDAHHASTAALDGSYVVTWADSGAIYAERHDNDGTLLGDRIAVSAGAEDDPEVAALSGGAFVITWENAAGYAGQVYSADGIPAGEAFEITASGDVSGVQGLSDGSFLVFYGDGNLCAQHYGANGNAIGDPVDVSGEVLNDGSATVSAAQLADGNVVVAWDYSYDQTNTEIHYRMLDTALNPVGTTSLVEAHVSNFSRSAPDVVALDTGGFIIAAQLHSTNWRDWMAGIKDESAAYVFNADGTLSHSSFVAGQLITNYHLPSVVALADGGYAMAWVGGEDHTNIMAASYDANGDRTSDVVELDGTLNNTNPSAVTLAVLSDGHLAAVWDGGDYAGIYQRIYSFHDIVTGTEGNDYLTTSERLAFIDGGAGNDTLVGSAGDDTLDGGSGTDSLNGGAGDDVLIGGADADVIDGGVGHNTVSYGNAGAAVTVSLVTDMGSGGDAEGDSYANVDNIEGSGYADRLIGSDADNVITAGGGNDTVAVGTGDDSVQAGAGDDLVYGGVGGDTLEGGAGDDTLVGADGKDSLSGGDGNDYLTGGDGDDTLYGYVGDDTLWGGTGDDLLSGGDGDNLLVGAAGDDRLFGGVAGADTLLGGDGNDELYGYGGDDSLSGGAGDDTLVGAQGGDTLDGGTGVDTVRYSFSDAGVSVNLTSGLGRFGDAEGDVYTGIENVEGSDHKDKLVGTGGDNNLSGGAGDDTIYAGAGDDTLSGGAGDDTIQGGAGDDVFISDAGADSLEGGTGDNEVSYAGSWEGVSITLADYGWSIAATGGTAEGDILANIQHVIGSGHDDSLTGNFRNNTLEGGMGDDTLTGGDGADTFVYGGGSGADVITDFNADEDMLDLSALGFADVAAVEAAASDTELSGEAGVLVDLGGGESVFLEGLSTSDLGDVNLVL